MPCPDGVTTLPFIIALQSRKRLKGQPENVAAAVLFFVENDFVTGACLPVDGGRTIYAAGS